MSTGPDATASGPTVRVVIKDLNSILRGWEAHFGAGNTAEQFVQIGRYVTRRLKRLQMKKRGRNLRTDGPLNARLPGVESKACTN